MALPRLILAWILVSAWFLAWEEARRRLSTSPNGERMIDRTTAMACLVEALLLTLFAALWFGSLGHGGWLLLFALVGLLIEVPRRLRNRTAARRVWLQVAADTVRIAAAGGLLAWRMG